MDTDTSHRMTVRAWARSRSIPSSTAAKAARDGRITRDSRGHVQPEIADAEWVANTRPRIDGRVPIPPVAIPPAVRGLLSDEDDPDPQGRVRLCELFPLLRWSDALLFDALHLMVDRLAPTLVGKSEAEMVAAMRQGIASAMREALAKQDDAEALATLDAALAESRRKADRLLARED